MEFVSGKIDTYRDYGEGYCTAIGDVPVVDVFNRHYGFSYVAYVLGPTFIGPMEFVNAAINEANGRIDADIHHRYSDVTGYLWTDEHAKVGGHDFLEILKSTNHEYAAILISDMPLDFDMLLAGPPDQQKLHWEWK